MSEHDDIMAAIHATNAETMANIERIRVIRAQTVANLEQASANMDTAIRNLRVVGGLLVATVLVSIGALASMAPALFQGIGLLVFVFGAFYIVLRAILERAGIG